MIRRLSLQTSRALAISAVLALAACETEQGAAPEASSQPSGSNAQAPSGTSSGGTGVASAGRVSTNCDTPDGGKVFFRVNDSVLALAPGEIDETIPAGMQPPLNAETLKAELDRRTAEGGGCPEKPLDMLVLAIRANPGDTLLQGKVGLLASDPSRLSSGYADVTGRLQSNPPENCRQLSADLLACTGTETVGNTKTNVMYIITTDKTKKMNSGGPLAARCALAEGSVRGCNIVDRGQGTFIMDAVLKQGEYTTAAIETAWRRALSEVGARIR